MRYKLTVTSKHNHTIDAVKKILKTSIDQIDIKIGMRIFKGLKDCKVIIEADTKEDIEKLNSQIRDKSGDGLETYVQKRRNPSIIIYNIPDEVALDKAENVIGVQNPELALQKRDDTIKFIFKTKRNTRSLVIELAPQTRRKILQNKL
jgi:hypothetical protein